MWHDDGPRLYWKLGVVDSLIQGNDSLVRAVNLRTNNRITSRSISRLFPLEVSLSSNDHTDDIDVNESTTDNVPDDTGNHPQWAAAKRARTRLLEWTTRLSCLPEDVKN